MRGKSSPAQQGPAPLRLASDGRSTAARRALWKSARRLIFWTYVRVCPLPPLLWLVSARNRRLLRNMRTIHRSGQFEADWYRGRYPGAVPAGMDPLEHYCRHGWRRGLDPNPRFATSLYLLRHPGAAVEGNPLVHAIRSAGRSPVEPPHAAAPGPAFDNAAQWYDDTHPEISIIILNFNKAALTAECLHCLWRHTEGHRYEIVVIDNGSTAEDFAVLSAVRGPFRLLRLSENRFFGEGNNIGAEEARAPVLCLMNNDVFVTPHWLQPLAGVLESRADCGLVGPRFLYPDGRVQEAGAMIEADGRVRRLDHGATTAPAGDDEVRDVDYVSAAAVLIRKSVFESVHGFDGAWEPVYYEDADLCLKIAVAGLKTYCCLGSAVIHHESVTTSDPGHGLQLGNVKEINRAKFVDRWGSRLANRHAGRSLPPVRRADPAPATTCPTSLATLALFLPGRLAPGGGVRYLLAFAEALQESYTVWLLSPERYSLLRAQAVARDLGLDLRGLRMLALDDAARCGRFDVAVVLGDDCLPPIAAPAKRSLFLCRPAAPPEAAERARRWRWWDGYSRIIVASAGARDHLAEATMIRL